MLFFVNQFPLLRLFLSEVRQFWGPDYFYICNTKTYLATETLHLRNISKLHSHYYAKVYLKFRKYIQIELNMKK